MGESPEAFLRDVKDEVTAAFFNGNPPTCASCGCEPFDKKYTEFGNEMVKAPAAATAAMAAGIIKWEKASASTLLEKGLKKAGYDDKAKSVSEHNPIDSTADAWDEHIAADVSWVERNGKHYCYKCKD
ncbi:hypothetical protein ACOJIV_17730 [Haloarcula sp. AONF1]